VKNGALFGQAQFATSLRQMNPIIVERDLKAGKSILESWRMWVLIPLPQLGGSTTKLRSCTLLEIFLVLTKPP